MIDEQTAVEVNHGCPRVIKIDRGFAGGFNMLFPPDLSNGSRMNERKRYIMDNWPRIEAWDDSQDRRLPDKQL